MLILLISHCKWSKHCNDSDGTKKWQTLYLISEAIQGSIDMTSKHHFGNTCQGKRQEKYEKWRNEFVIIHGQYCYVCWKTNNPQTIIPLKYTIILEVKSKFTKVPWSKFKPN